MGHHLRPDTDSISDTTAATLTNALFLIATKQSQALKLQTELDAYFQDKETIDHASLSKLKYLDAFINETLRLHPVVPSGLQRVAPKDGLTVDNVFIPGGTYVKAPLHTIFRGSYFLFWPYNITNIL